MPKDMAAFAQEVIVDDKGNHVVAYAYRDEPGYALTTYVGDLAYCKETAKHINATLGLTDEDVTEIIGSSMAAGPVCICAELGATGDQRHTRCRAHDTELER